MELVAEISGHSFYKPIVFKDNITERYLNYIRIVSQYEQLGMRLTDIRAFCDQALVLSRENNTKDLHTLIEVLNSYALLEEKNDITFEVAANFLYLDDEPLDKISAKHYAAKRQLYDKFPEVKVFFCEVFRSLLAKPEKLKEVWHLWEALQDKANVITEETFLRLTKADRFYTIQERP